MVAKITLPADIAETVHHLVSDGDYPDSDSVFREAFQLLDEHREFARLRQSIIDADRSIDEGRGVPWNDETRARIRANAEEMVRRGIAPNPDVCP